MIHQIRHRGDTGRLYAGATMHAAPGTHEAALSVLQHIAPTGTPVLDIGAGSGAFSLRLRDAGWQPTAVDLAAPSELRGIEIIEADVSDVQTVIAPRRFPTIVAIETIEHLVNPTLFLNECFQILQPGGMILVTTPNVLHPYSRLKYLAKGRLLLFDDAAYWSTGHITPLPEWLLREHLRAAGFIDIKHGYGGTFYAHGLRKYIFRALSLVSRRPTELPSMGHRVVLIMAARRPYE